MPQDLALPKLTKTPVWKIDPKVWKNWAKIPSFLPFVKNKDKFLEEPTEAFLAYDNDYCYIAVHCSEKRRTPIAESSQPWCNECVELYWQMPDGKHSAVICDAVGNLYSQTFDAKKMKVLTQTVDKDGWYILLAVPWKVLGASSPELGRKIRFNIIRNRIGSRPEVSTWGPIKSGYTEMKNFGTLTVGRFKPGQGRFDEFIAE